MNRFYVAWLAKVAAREAEQRAYEQALATLARLAAERVGKPS